VIVEKSVFDGKTTDVPKPHFDTNHHLTIVSSASDPHAAANRLKDAIRFTIPEAPPVNWWQPLSCRD